MITHDVSRACSGEFCRVCGLSATHKLAEEILFDDPLPARHPLTAYVCCAHFLEIVGRTFAPCGKLDAPARKHGGANG